MLTLPDDFSRSSGMNMCWYKDSSPDASLTDNTGFKVRHDILIKSTPKGTFSFSVPLSHLLGFADDFDKVIYGFSMQLVLNRHSNNEAIFQNQAAVDAKIHLTKCLALRCHPVLSRLFRSLRHRFDRFSLLESLLHIVSPSQSFSWVSSRELP